MLKISHLSKSFQNQPILKDITFSIEKGGTTGISGKNGAGKTTLLRIIAGIVSPDGGDILLDEKPLLKKITMNSDENCFIWDILLTCTLG